MAEPLDPKELVTIEEVAVSNMWEITALVEVLERKGMLTRQEFYEMTQKLRLQMSQAPQIELTRSVLLAVGSFLPTVNRLDS